MNKIILICGRICSGKTVYAKNIANDLKAVILSINYSNDIVLLLIL